MDLRALLELIETGPRTTPIVPDEARFHTWLRTGASAELAEWNAALSEIAVRGGYRNTLFPAVCPTLSDVLAEPDGRHAARIRSVFLGASAILEDAEELWLATWGATAENTSVVFASHQDERDLWPVAPSIADFVLEQLRADPYFAKDSELAARLPSTPSRMEGAPLPPHLDPMKLSPRLHWIVALLFPEGDWYGLGNGLVTAVDYSIFERERDLLPKAPHLLSYWLLHHRVFGNREAFASLVGAGHASDYPPARELAEERLAWWNETAVARLAAEALRTKPGLFEPAATARLASTMSERQRLRSLMATEIEAQPESAARMLAAAVLQGATLAEIDVEIIRDAGPRDPDANLAEILLAKRGNAPGASILLEQIAEDVDASWASVAAHQWGLLATGEGGEDQLVLAILCSAADTTWAELRARSAEYAELAKGRWPRLALAAVALRLSDDAAIAFLREEAKRFLAQLPRSATDTAALALDGLLRARDPVAIAELERAFAAKDLHGGATRALLETHPPDPAFAKALEAIVKCGFGRATAGEPVIYAARFARAAPERARFPEAATEPMKRLSQLAAMIVATGEGREEAVALLNDLDPKDEKEAGTALGFFRAMHEAKIDGFAEAAVRWREAKISRNVGGPLARWFKENFANS